MNIRKRLLPAALIVIVTVGCILLSRPTRVLFFAVLSVISAYELDNVLTSTPYSIDKPTFVGVTAAMTCMSLLGGGAVWFIALYALGAFWIMLHAILKPALGGQYVISNLFALVWPFGFYAIAIAAAGSELWLQTLAIAILGAWACDCMALIGGKYLGKRKLCPAVSPNKTWEGAVVGGACSIIAGFLISLILKPFAPIPALPCMLITLIASTFGQIGDLAASLIKRMAGAKDYGHLMPEHGGIMDKMDSMLFAIPAAFLGVYIYTIL